VGEFEEKKKKRGKRSSKSLEEEGEVTVFLRGGEKGRENEPLLKERREERGRVTDFYDREGKKRKKRKKENTPTHKSCLLSNA